MPAPANDALDVRTDSGLTVRVRAVSACIFHVQVSKSGRFPDSGLSRYGVVRTDWPEVPVTVTESAGIVSLSTGQAALEICRADGRVVLRDASGKAVLQSADPPEPGEESGFRAEFALAENEGLYGLGDETRDRLNKRGHETAMVMRNVASYAPIPFLMSTGGWAVFLNTTWFHHVDAGASQPDRLTFSARRGDLDLYLIAGDTLPALLDHYTQLTGRPTLLPLWGYGLTWVCDERGVRARDVLYEAHEFRRQGIPCDGFGLEPDWMETRYDFSVDKNWSEERFHQPFWMPHQRPGGFCAALKNMGFKLSLWLCCDYDVSEDEEQLISGEAAQGSELPALADDRYEEDIIKDPHFVPAYQDRITKQGEPWFQHLRKFVDNGAAAFKMDGSNQVCFHPDRKWRNGMDDEEMHNLYPVLLAKQMSLGFREHTRRRAMIYTAGGYAGIQQYAATWAGDTGGEAKPLVSLLNHGLSGHSNTSCDMQVWNAPGIHFGFLQPWSQILCWHQYNQPWFLPEDVYRVFRYYARLRYRLIPYLYSAAHVAARTGLPIMRAMPLVAPADPKSDDCILQYMLGEWMLTCAFTDTIHLPAGTWIDYWTGESHEGPCDIQYQPPEDRGGPLFVKAGAIIPTWPEMDFVGQRPLDCLGIEVFPSDDSEFTLFEDDGMTDAYLEGQVATTHITCSRSPEAVEIALGPREGRYEGMPASRAWDLCVHLNAPPEEVTVDGAPMPQCESGWRYDRQAGLLKLRVSEDPQRARPRLVRAILNP